MATANSLLRAGKLIPMDVLFPELGFIWIDKPGLHFCPFHQERTKTLHVGKWHFECAGNHCGIHGGAITLVMLVRNLYSIKEVSDFLTALSRIVGTRHQKSRIINRPRGWFLIEETRTRRLATTSPFPLLTATQQKCPSYFGTLVNSRYKSRAL